MTRPWAVLTCTTRGVIAEGSDAEHGVRVPARRSRFRHEHQYIYRDATWDFVLVRIRTATIHEMHPFTTISCFSLASHDGPYSAWPLTTPLLCDGVPTGRRVPGFVIEGQYRWGDLVLLINSWDCPFEESYDFLLLNAQHEIIARTSLGVPYGSYLLHAHWPVDATSLRLHFYLKQCFTLTVLSPSGWFHRRHRLRLKEHLITPSDERTQASVSELAATLAQIKAQYADEGTDVV